MTSTPLSAQDLKDLKDSLLKACKALLKSSCDGAAGQQVRQFPIARLQALAVEVGGWDDLPDAGVLVDLLTELKKSRKLTNLQFSENDLGERLVSFGPAASARAQHEYRWKLKFAGLQEVTLWLPRAEAERLRAEQKEVIRAAVERYEESKRVDERLSRKQAQEKQAESDSVHA